MKKILFSLLLVGIIVNNANAYPGADYSFTGIDSYGAVARYTFEEFSKTSINNGIGFIVKEAKTWAEGASKDVDSDRFMDFSNLTRDEYGYYNIYLNHVS